jgi:hypothetical protein
MNDTPTPIPFATDGQRTTDAECWMNYCLEAEKQLATVTEQRDDYLTELQIVAERLKGNRHPDDNGIMADGEIDVKEIIEQRDRLAKACDQYSEDEMLGKLQEITERWDRLMFSMKEIYNISSFDYDTMPEAARRLYHGIVLEIADKARKSTTNPNEP